ncbi:expressed unknown protein [Seminavis robusta]|uniref:Uncharacterized protein n=1 Tax=Seminavis robusta TaxID=568900 RepID=A0A9N8DL23_9STRA|nr:expressed unknown protein [Seminavis robusta]|eukprot:Sro115_g056870.1 n/a (161) ;mRNA; r:94579-95061
MSTKLEWPTQRRNSACSSSSSSSSSLYPSTSCQQEDLFSLDNVWKTAQQELPNPTGRPLMEVTPNVRAPYFDASYTTQAVLQNQHVITTCYGCSTKLACLYGMQYVACPACHGVGLVEERITLTYPRKACGVGIGLRRKQQKKQQQQQPENNKPVVASSA